VDGRRENRRTTWARKVPSFLFLPELTPAHAAMPPAPQSQASIRLALNLKNLRRHDASITDIVGSASYATAYWNVGGDWVRPLILVPCLELMQRALDAGEDQHRGPHVPVQSVSSSIPPTPARAHRDVCAGRSREPKYGFFILNRNGLENILEDLTAESEVRMEGEFILFEPFAEAGGSHTSRTT
jgi:hypothetical protein